MNGMGIPEAIILVLYAVELLGSVVNHGKTLSKKVNAYATALGVAIGVWLLWVGGFFA